MPSISDVKKEPKTRPVTVRKQEGEPQPSPEEEAGAHQLRIVRWQAPEYTYYEKTADWYWTFGIVVAGLLVSAYYLGSILFAFLIVIGGFGILLYSVRRPLSVTFEVSGMGVRVGDRLFPYETLQSFWIFYRPGGPKELSLRSERMFVPTVTVPLGDQDPLQVRELLLEFLEERPQEESLIDILARLLKF